jgi:transposase-like protein
MLSNSFKWKHFVSEIILLDVRWYLKYSLSYRNLKEMMIEKEIQVDHSTIMRWVHQYSPEIEKKIRRHLRRFRCKKSGDFTKLLKIFTIRKVNHFHHRKNST